ncbi:ZYRO0A01782p [Zygosaccharomyces rouxii]|uniref:ZYRO0A01782p n=1 Tax=Zygosaccharomyces rouxii (strain ATCC 2623 / CBS 732 / NBRC 1130 / NCYC 568 / NRRL Y-229) TaxID=559307 RepID=C5DPA8_ZYGRC|nr:uncharacterized protein ZYRO0A01782g [Zygosaccharomyces rouxii]KAH9198961.1 Threonyl/alanyl tRNA synthetase [Zygosaccharomyces rouxii]CAR25519.1 ZYRO0A01782p [Zygosaccharomyces rouxii]
MVTESLTRPTTVGALACQRNSFLFNGFKTTVISCEPVKGKPKDPVKYLVELHDTILFPEGGGQPSDSGYLKCSNDRIPVSYVSRVGLHAKHHVGQYIDPGTTVEVEVDQSKRVDYMQQHTGQHLLSAILESEPYKLDTLSWSMGGVISAKKPTLEINDYFNYIELPRKLTSQEIEQVSHKVNELISINPQQISVIERTPEAHGDVQTSKIPDDYDLEKGVLRTIHIGEIDSNPCCGTHLQRTNQIGSILISPNQTNIRGSNSRLYFMCGNRVVNYGMAVNKLVGTAKSSLSCLESEIPEKIDRQRDLIQKSSKREQFWIKELASYESDRLLAKVKEAGKAFLLKDEYGTLEFLLQVFKEFTNKLGKTPNEYQLVLCGREKSTESGSVLIVSESGEKISTIAASLSGVVPTLKGGGGKKGGKWQGKIVKFTENDWKSVKNYLETEF